VVVARANSAGQAARFSPPGLPEVYLLIRGDIFIRICRLSCAADPTDRKHVVLYYTLRPADVRRLSPRLSRVVDNKTGAARTLTPLHFSVSSAQYRERWLPGEIEKKTKLSFERRSTVTVVSWSARAGSHFCSDQPSRCGLPLRVRSGSVKRVVQPVAEGAMAVQFVPSLDGNVENVELIARTFLR